MYFLNRLAKIIAQLDRLAQKYQDEELRAVVADLYRQLALFVNVVERIYSIYAELDMIIKLDLSLDPIYLEVEAPTEPERLSSYMERIKASGLDPNKAVAYLLASGMAQIQHNGGDVVIVPKRR